jgi:ABC-type cobalamin/Fe3+-siderophores transport system ATPase subunit
MAIVRKMYDIAKLLIQNGAIIRLDSILEFIDPAESAEVMALFTDLEIQTL